MRVCQGSVRVCVCVCVCVQGQCACVCVCMRVNFAEITMVTNWQIRSGGGMHGMTHVCEYVHGRYFKGNEPWGLQW